MPVGITNEAIDRNYDWGWTRSVDMIGRTFTATATEFGDKGEDETERITLTVHHSDFRWNSLVPRLQEVHANVVHGQVSIDIGELTVWVPVGTEQALADALAAAIEEQDRQVAVGEEETVVGLTATKSTTATEVVKDLLSDSPNILAAEKWLDEVSA